MKRSACKFLIVILSLIMIFSMCSSVIYAEGIEDISGEDTSLQNAFAEITTEDEMTAAVANEDDEDTNEEYASISGDSGEITFSDNIDLEIGVGKNDPQTDEDVINEDDVSAAEESVTVDEGYDVKDETEAESESLESSDTKAEENNEIETEADVNNEAQTEADVLTKLQGYSKKVKTTAEKETEKVSADKDSKKEETTTKEDLSIKKITLDKTSVDLATNKTLKLKATVTPENTKEKLVWSSSDEEIAKVDKDGNVTALKYGKVKITVANEKGTQKAICTVQTRYYDVNDAAKYFYEPVYWAAEKGITRGYDDVYFGPKQTCTRREMVILLWRYMGKPKASGKMPFSDVKYGKNSDSYKAILWGSKKGIIKGYDNRTFKPNAPVIRKDAMIMLYRLTGKPKASGNIPYADVRSQGYKKTSDTYKSILWGNTVGITHGYSDRTFKPLANCLREHIVTFLYRHKDNKNKLAYLATPEVTATYRGDQIALKWKKVNNAESYDVYRFIYSKGQFRKIANVKDPNYDFGKVNRGDLFRFKIVARATGVVSDTTKEIVCVCIDAPKLNSAKANATGIKVTWNKVAGAKKYTVLRKTEKGKWKEIGDTSATSFQDNACDSGVKYFYTVAVARNSLGVKYLGPYDKKGKSAKFTNPVMDMARKRLKAVGGTLRKAYLWSVNIEYVSDQPERSNAGGYAKWAFQNGMGDCIGKAATFVYMARALGYEARLIYGSVPLASGNIAEHAWAEIYKDGSWYVCDPAFDQGVGRNGYFIHYGQSGTWRYQKSHIIPFN